MQHKENTKNLQKKSEDKNTVNTETYLKNLVGVYNYIGLAKDVTEYGNTGERNSFSGPNVNGTQIFMKEELGVTRDTGINDCISLIVKCNTAGRPKWTVRVVYVFVPINKMYNILIYAVLIKIIMYNVCHL